MTLKWRVYETIVSPVLDTCTARSLSPAGWHDITPRTADIDAFSLRLPGRGRYQRRRIRGALDPDVMAALDAAVSPGDTVFDVGAAWGYFALAAAMMGGDVYAFEVESSRVDDIDRAADRNDVSVTTVDGAVGAEVSVDDYPTPDVVKMDIEGWEYEVIKNASETVGARPTWIIELHHPDRALDSAPAHPPEDVTGHLEAEGYDIERLDKRENVNYHIIARP